MFKRKTYKEKAEVMKNKITRKESDKFKKLCIKKFKENIKQGMSTTVVDFCSNVTYDFEDEISEIVLKELKEEYKNIEFSFSFRHYNNSYRGICMVAI